MSAYQSPHNPPDGRLGRLALAINLLTIAVLWTSHGSLAERIDDGTPAIEDIQERIDATESRFDAVQTTLNEQWRGINELKLGEIYQTEGIVDLSQQRAQYIGKGFGVTKLAVEGLASGIMVRGRMINMQVVRHSQPRFRLTLGDHAEEFELDEMASGQSRAFAVFVPDAGRMTSRFARIDFLDSTIWYVEGP